MVGALARLNLAKNNLCEATKQSLGATLDLFPSKNIFHNNLAQAIEILHCLDEAKEILTHQIFGPEPIIKQPARNQVGIGVIEAPRGTLYHKMEINAAGMVQQGEIVVPTGQNQVGIEKNIGFLVQGLIDQKSSKKTNRP